MELNSINNKLEFNDAKPAVRIILESDFTKEIRIAMKEGQIMKEHQTPYPIVIHMIKGELDFGVNGEVHRVKEGDMLSLSGGVPHDLTAISESVIRLTLSKTDLAQRVQEVAKS